MNDDNVVKLPIPKRQRKRKQPKPRLPNGKRDQSGPFKHGKSKSERGAKPPIPGQSSTVANSLASPREIKHQEKVAEALEYRRQGHAYHVIGEQMGISTAWAYQLVAEGLHNIVTEPANELYTLEMERLNEFLSSIYAAAAGGDMKAIETCLKIQERIDRLVGLERAADLANARGTTINQNILIKLVGDDE